MGSTFSWIPPKETKQTEGRERSQENQIFIHRPFRTAESYPENALPETAPTIVLSAVVVAAAGGRTGSTTCTIGGTGKKITASATATVADVHRTATAASTNATQIVGTVDGRRVSGR